ncbi:DUF123 domain-containing protein [Thermococcus sp. MV5]|uniref:GIY-YIG nuclease family protein n=1 Tax=Thermococcus sp. MV5 TaxID=1638272 RepID=UPI00143AE3AC|nr:DUF123 domain-containing protein [Thermococcus sp. MV5]NJE25116.1 DUF123 domain-containing protein [Thermococcus sp. MV5]
MKGGYFLVIYLEKSQNIRTKAKGFSLKKGYYVYVGSAMRSLEKRVSRHFKKKKRFHWHIDYLLDKAQLIDAYLIPTNAKIEEKLSQALNSAVTGIEGFGASDVAVKTNLYYFGDTPPYEVLTNILNSMKLRWKRVKNPRDIMEWREENVEDR